ncbi:MAG: Peptidoglycan-associated lipoprotein [Chlamydiales bacterium]|nr:Peptidoglycan-associated lipoprotein [Chlamydiales bacterium]
MKTTLLCALLTTLLCTSCARSRCELWEDTKTCGRYVNKGMRSLMGHHVDSREYVAYYEQWDEGTAQSELDYVPLTSNEQTQTLAMQEYASSKESPGDPGSKIPGIDGFTTPSGKLAELFKNVRFSTDSYSVTGSETVASLHKIANYLASHPDKYVFVEGHADERGAAAYNLALGSRRANAVRAFLIQNGANPDQLFTISYGVERPLDFAHMEESWQKNRRAQFKIFAR